MPKKTSPVKQGKPRLKTTEDWQRGRPDTSFHLHPLEPGAKPFRDETPKDKE